MFVVCWVLGFGVLLAIECLWVCGLLAITRSSGVLWFLVHWYVCLSVGFICGLVVILFACWCVVLFYCWWGWGVFLFVVNSVALMVLLFWVLLFVIC